MGPHTQNSLEQPTSDPVEQLKYLRDVAGLKPPGIAKELSAVGRHKITDRMIRDYLKEEDPIHPPDKRHADIERVYRRWFHRMTGRPNPAEEIRGELRTAIDGLTEEQLYQLEESGWLEQLVDMGADGMRERAKQRRARRRANQASTSESLATQTQVDQ